MANSRQETLIKKFLMKPVKVLYQDGKYKISIARGILTGVDENFLFLDGNYCNFCIDKSSIKKISSPVSEVQYDQS